MYTLIPCYLKHLIHDLGVQPFVTILLSFNKPKLLDGANTGHLQEKTPDLTRLIKAKFQPHSGELTERFRDNALNISLSPRQTELHYIYIIYIRPHEIDSLVFGFARSFEKKIETKK